MKRREKALALGKLTVPKSDSSTFMTSSGTFQDGDIFVNMCGLRVGENTPVASPGDGQVSLADLETVCVIGKGSSGIVQLVRHKWTDQIFALKVIQMNIQENIRKQILRELKILHKSQCPHIVMCYDAFHSNGVISIMLEYMDGGSLADIIKSGKRFSEPSLAVIARQVLKGLSYLHEKKILHRDIKPSNLLVNYKGEVKISDFGVSAVLANSIGQAATFVGTCTYMSPERISGSTYGYDSDVWSLGLSLLECALGCFPYKPAGGAEVWLNFYDLLERIVEKPPPVAPQGQFSPEFCSFVSSCLQKEPKDRATVSELLNHPFVKMYEGHALDTSQLTSKS